MQNKYSDEELKEFKELIISKLEKAQREYDSLKETHSKKDNSAEDTNWQFRGMEEGNDVLSQEEIGYLFAKQDKFIKALKAALIRIENKSYGICSKTDQLIPKERLLAVPHTTVTVDCKR